MKKQTKRISAILILIIALTFTDKAYSQIPGNACSNAITLTPQTLQGVRGGTMTVTWYEFTAIVDTIDLELNSLTSTLVNKIEVFDDACSSSRIVYDTIVNSSDSVLKIHKENYDIGHIYKVKVTSTSAMANYDLIMLTIRGAYLIAYDLNQIPYSYCISQNGTGNSQVICGVTGNCNLSACPTQTLYFRLYQSLACSCTSANTNWLFGGLASNISSLTYTMANQNNCTGNNAFIPLVIPSGATPGTYSITAQIIAPCGACVSTGTQSTSYFLLNVISSVVTPTITVVTPVCTNISAQIDNSTQFGNAGTLYNYGDFSSNSIQPSHTYTAAGTYTITKTKTTGFCSGQTESAVVQVTDYAVNLSLNYICSLNVDITKSLTCTLSSMFGTYVHEWTIINGSGTQIYHTYSGNNPTINFTFPSVGTYSIVLGTQVVNGPGHGTYTETQTITINPPPLSLGVTSSGNPICSGQTATLTLSGATSYTWNTGATTSTIAVTPSSSTTYSAIGTNSCGTGTLAITLSVTPTPIVVVSNATICTGTSTVLTASGATTYSWNTGVTTASISLNPTVTTTYTVIGTTNGCSNTKTVTVTVNTTPTVAVGNATICSGTPTVITASGATTYSWNTGVTTASISLNPSVTTTYTVIGTTAGCSNTKTVSVTVKTTPTVAVNNATICSGASTVITAGGATTYSWNTGVTTASISLNPTTTTNYTVIGTTNGCSNTKTVSVTVNTTPTVTVSNATICIGSSTLITASGANTYSWSTGVTTASITLSPTVTTIYTVTGTSLGCINTKTVSVTANSLPTVIVTSPGTVCAGQSKTLTASGATTYTWSTGANTSSIVVTPTINTTYTVTDKGSSCAASAVTSVSVFTNPVLAVSASPTIVCLSTSTLTASGATTYSWNTGPTSNTIAITPTVTTIYTVTGTASGCSATQTISVAYGATAPIVSVSSNTPVSCGGTTTLTASGGASYTWTPGGATTSTIAVTTSVVTVYTITSTFGGSCGTGTTAVVINPNTSTLCCSSSNTTMGTSLTSTLAIAGTYSGSVVDVRGTLLSTGSVTFTGCTLRMGQGARIVMSPDDDLTLINCKLFSCSELWDGIYFQTRFGKIGNITVSTSTIEDMYNGIVMDYDGFAVPTTPVCGNVTIDQSVLNKNYVSIQIKNSSGPSSATPYGLALTSSTISSNTSTTSPGSTLKPSSTYTYAYNTITNGTMGNSAPYLDFPRAYTGIYLNRLGSSSYVKIGDNSSSSYTNTFDNMDFGVYGTDAKINVQNNYFKNITGSYMSPDILHGGIYRATGPVEIGVAVLAAHTGGNTFDLVVGSGTVVPASNPYPKGNKFEDCNKGVKSDNAGTTSVSGNLFTSASTDIPVVTTSGSPPSQINNPNTYYYYKAQNAAWYTTIGASARFYYNYVRNHNVGAYASVSTGTITGFFEFNDIASPSATGYCKNAFQLEQAAGTISSCSVKSNTIANVYNGLTANSLLTGLAVVTNSISIETTAKTYNHGATSRRTGVTLNYCEYANVQGNSITGNGSVPSTSTTAQYLNGVYYLNSKLGKVECNTTTALGRDFVFEGICNNRWLVNSMSNSYIGLEIRSNGVIDQQGSLTYTGTPNLSANTWTTITRQTSVISSPSVNATSKLYLLAGGNTEPTLNFATIAGQTYTTGFGNGIQTTTGTSYTCAGGYAAQRMVNGSGGKNNRTIENQDSLTLYTFLATNDVNDYEVFPNEFVYQGKQMVYRLIKQDSIDPIDSSPLENFYTTNLNSDMDKLTQVQQAIALNNINDAVSKNISVATVNIVEQKYQRANELALKYLADHSYNYTANERQDLTTLANECLVKGYYVIQSRNILSLISNHLIAYDDNCDSEANNSRKTQSTDKLLSSTSFALFPNPNNGAMQFDYDLGNDNIAVMSLCDVTGKLIKSYKLDGTKGSLQLNEQNLHNGIYFYRILVGDKIIKTDKVVIIK